MNLAKKGTVLLAALSVFAMTSCGGGEKEITAEEATKWVNEHYKQSERKVPQIDTAWDYSKNVPSEEKFGEMDINAFVSFALMNEFKVSVEKSTEKNSSEIVTREDTDFTKNWNVDKITNRIKGDDEEPKFYTSGNKLHIVSINNSRSFPVGAIKVIIDVKSRQDYYFDNNMFLEKYVYKMTDDVCHVYNKETPAQGANLGKLDFTVTTTPIVAK